MLGVAAACIVAFLLARLLLRRERGDLIAVPNAGPLSFLLSPLWPPKGWLGNYWAHFIPFERAGRTVIPGISPLTAQRFIYVADAAACKLILNDRHTFVKNAKHYQVVQFFGKNVLGTDGDEWVRHRSIARKSFGERNNALVWTETLRILDDWFTPWDAEIVAGKQTTADVSDALRHITLFIIASAGFGLHLSRRAVGERRAGFSMPFAEALFTAIETMFLRIAAPRALYALPIPALRRSDAAYVELERYIRQMIAEARTSDTDTDEAADLFKRLIAANDATDAHGARLTDDELVSNIYVYFLAGHETSAHTLTFALALLAIHPEAQTKLYEEAKSVWPDIRPRGESWSSSTIADYSKLEYTLAVFRETLRLFPPAVRLGRWSTGHATLPCEARNGAGQWEPGCVSIAPGTPCILNISAIHMSPLYWGADAAAFRPERFIDTPDWKWPRDAWVPFIGGHHVCLGQRFATVESVCILARMIRKYRLTPTPDIAKLSREEQWARLTKWTPGVTSTPGPVNLVLERRDD